GASAASADRLRSYPHAIARFAHAAFQDMAAVQSARDLAHVHRLALEGERGVAGADEQRRYLGEIGDDVLADAVGEVFLLRLAAYVLVRENADRGRHFL